MRRNVVALLALCLVLFLSGRARAAYTVSLLTFGPGAEVYERFGHNAIRIRDDARGIDECFDWGNFRFSNDFVLLFVKGDLFYWMQGGKPGKEMLAFYVGEQDRTVTEQVLNLSPAQTQLLIRALLENNTDANRLYRYDYYRDNCSTRARDALDRAVDGQIRATLAEPTDHSLRWHTRRLMPVGVVNKLCETLADLACGPRIDVPLTRWDAGFLPMELADGLDHVQVRMDDGSMQPLVRERLTLHVTTSPGNVEPAEPWNPLWATLPFSILGSGLLLTLAARGWTRSFRLLASAWEAFVLFGALFMPTIILFTWHWVVAWNENLLQFTPLSLLVLGALWIGRLRRPLRWATAAAVALSAVGALLTISHLTPQRNAPAVVLALPLHVAVMLGQAWTSTVPRRRDASGPIEDAAAPSPASA